MSAILMIASERRSCARSWCAAATVWVYRRAVGWGTAMVQHRKFEALSIDDEGVHTPDGTLDLASITRAEVIRNRVRPGPEPTSESSPAGIAGGALVGGAVAGPVGMLGGGLLGSTIKRESDTSDGIPRTTSATIILESPELAYSTTVGRDLVSEAEAFVASVRAAANLK